MVNALRVGLLTRWMGVLGIFTGMLIFLPIGGATLEVVPAFWMVVMGILYAGRWPNGEPPAWAAGEARPWPIPGTATRGRQARAKGKVRAGGRSRDVAPAPARRRGSSRKRRRKRGARSGEAAAGVRARWRLVGQNGPRAIDRWPDG